MIDYASVKQRLVPLLAQATALVLVGQNVKRAYDAYTANYLKTGDFSQLEDFHLQTVGAKVYSTEITGHGIETCRIMCGGHGYHALSGFGRLYGNAINAVTLVLLGSMRVMFEVCVAVWILELSMVRDLLLQDELLHDLRRRRRRRAR